MALPDVSFMVHQQPPSIVTRDEYIDPPVVARLKLRKDDAEALVTSSVWATVSLETRADGKYTSGLQGGSANSVEVETESDGYYAVFDFTFTYLQVLQKGGFHLRITLNNLFCVDNTSLEQLPYVETARFAVFD